MGIGERDHGFEMNYFNTEWTEGQTSHLPEMFKHPHTHKPMRHKSSLAEERIRLNEEGFRLFLKMCTFLSSEKLKSVVHLSNYFLFFIFAKM